MRRAALMSFVVLATLATPAVALGGGCHGGTSGRIEVARAEGAAAIAHAAECGFYPTVLYVDMGAEVTWINKDPVPHTITGAQLSWGSEETIARGEEIGATFPKEGVFPYFCLLHPGMVGAVVVGDPDPKDIAATSSMTMDMDKTDAVPTSEEQASGSSVEPMTYAGFAFAAAFVGAAVWFLVRRRRVTPA